jgi:hypothetical protein
MPRAALDLRRRVRTKPSRRNLDSLREIIAIWQLPEARRTITNASTIQQITGANDRHLSQVCRTIIGSAGQRSVAEFDKLTDAMQLCGKLQSGERSEIHFRGELVWTKPFADGVSDNTDAQAEALLAQFADKYDPGK